MSFWSQLGVKIEDLACFQASCEKNDVKFTMNEDYNYMSPYSRCPVVASLKDGQGNGTALLVRKDGAIQLEMDVDESYSSIARRFGKGGGRLCRDYTEAVIRKQSRKMGGMVNQSVEQPDGSLLLRVSVG